MLKTDCGGGGAEDSDGGGGGVENHLMVWVGVLKTVVECMFLVPVLLISVHHKCHKSVSKTDQ